MNKLELVKYYAKFYGVTQEESVEELAQMTDFLIGLVNSLSLDEKVTLQGFGAFGIVERAGRNGRNPGTGEAIVITSKKVVKFEPQKTLKESVNNKQ